MKNYQKIELVQTCGAFPEQYDAYLNGVEVGYLRLRHGYFRAEHNGVTVYESQTIGEGCFHEIEREFHLTEAKIAIYNSIKTINNN